MDKPLIVYCTCPDPASAARLADGLVEDRLAACVSIISGVTSVYSWQGEIRHDAEILLLIKTSAARYAALESSLKERHPYELPEIIAVPIERGLPDYLKWVEACTLAED